MFCHISGLVQLSFYTNWCLIKEKHDPPPPPWIFQLGNSNIYPVFVLYCSELKVQSACILVSSIMFISFLAFGLDFYAWIWVLAIDFEKSAICSMTWYWLMKSGK